MLSKAIVNQEQIDTLVLEGCAARCSSYAGGIATLEEAKMWDNIHDIHASSSGCIIAFFGLFGMGSKEMMDMIYEMNSSPLFNKTRSSQIPLIGAPLSIAINRGVNRADNLVRFARNILERRGFRPNLTFGDLAKLKRLHPHLKNIHFTALNHSRTATSELTIFSHTNEQTRDVEIAKALAAAMAYPGFIVPQKILINGKDYLLVDGGGKDNYPFDIKARSKQANCVGMKVDKLYEVFYFQDDDNPSFAKMFYWNLLTDNHFIYSNIDNSIPIVDGDIDSFKPLTLIDHQALYLSGKLAVSARLKIAATPEEEKEQKQNHARKNPNADHINTATERYKKMMELDSTPFQYLPFDSANYFNPQLIYGEIKSLASRYLFPTYYINLQLIYEELKSWDVEKYGCAAHYNALLCQLAQQPTWSLGDVLITGFALSKLHSDLFLLLREHGAKAALFSDATPNLITDILLAYLQTKDYQKAYDLFSRLEKNPDSQSKLLKIDNQRILQILQQDTHSSTAKDALTQSVGNNLENLLRTYPGAYESYIIAKFGSFLESKQYGQARVFLFKMQEFAEDRLNAIYSAAMQSFEKNSEQYRTLQEMLLINDNESRLHLRKLVS